MQEDACAGHRRGHASPVGGRFEGHGSGHAEPRGQLLPAKIQRGVRGLADEPQGDAGPALADLRQGRQQEGHPLGLGALTHVQQLVRTAVGQGHEDEVIDRDRVRQHDHALGDLGHGLAQSDRQGVTDGDQPERLSCGPQVGGSYLRSSQELDQERGVLGDE